jgi:hypothetical protein
MGRNKQSDQTCPPKNIAQDREKGYYEFPFARNIFLKPPEKR